MGRATNYESRIIGKMTVDSTIATVTVFKKMSRQYTMSADFALSLKGSNSPFDSTHFLKSQIHSRKEIYVTQ